MADNIMQMSRLVILLFCSALVVQTIATTPITVSVQSVSNSLIQSALDFLNEDLPAGQSYKGGNLISAQKLLQPPYAIFRLILNLELDCNESNCPQEACVINVQEHENGGIEVERKSKQCMPQNTQLVSQDEQSSRRMQDLQEAEMIESLEKQKINNSVRLDHEVQDFPDQNDKPFIAVRSSHTDNCPNCPYELNPTLPGLTSFSEAAAASLDDSGRSEYKHRVVSIVHVTRAVPSGSNVVRYELLLEIGQTNCLIKTPVLRSECPVQSNEPIQTCLVTFDERPWLQNSRELTRNNCTVLRDRINDLNGSGVQPNLVGESLVNGDDIDDQEEEVRTDMDDQVAQEGQISTYESPLDEFMEVAVSSAEPEHQDRDIEAEVTEPRIKKTVLIKDTKQKPVGYTGFVDKKKEFDEFLKDFDVPVKFKSESEPTNYGPEVTEETIQPERVDSEVSVEQVSSASIRSRRSPAPGSPQQINITHPDVQKYVNEGLKKFSAQSESSNEPIAVEIVEATRQTVAGELFVIKVKLGESNCPKGQGGETCLLVENSPIKDCTIKAWSRPWLSDIQITVECDANSSRRRKRQTLGGFMEVDVDHPDVQEFVQQGLRKFSAESEGSNEPIKVRVVEAKKKVVAGELFQIKVKVGESNCPKGQGAETCLLVENSPVQDCTIEVWKRSWLKENGTQITVKCDSASRPKRNVGVNYSQKMMNLAQNLKDEEKFLEFQKKHNKVYATEQEKNERFGIFRINMRIAENFQEHEQGTAEYGASMFADLTREEFRTQYLGLRPDLRSDNEIPYPHAEIPDIELPKEFDWRHYNVVTPVKDQGSCGSCWAFSVTGNVEGQYAIKYKNLLSLSEQELVDCDKLDEGCNGGLQESAYRALENLGGLELESDYPYDGKDEKCHFKKAKAAVQVVSAVNITSNETQMAQWMVQNGPMAIGINANAMQFYMGGVSHPFGFLCNKNNLDHGVLIVGYGIHTYPIFKKQMPFWIIKNSWGPGWGESGYYRVYRGDGTCGVNTDVSSAVVA